MSPKPRVELKWRRPWLYPKQRAAIFDSARFSIIEASTKSGKTFGCMAWIAERAFRGRRGQNFWWVAPVYSVAKIAYRRMKRYLPRSIYQHNDSELTLTFLNGTIIVFKSGEKPDNLYGEDVFGAVMDEASRMREEAFHAIRTTLSATRGPIRIIGNVKGRKNWFFAMARKAEQGDPGRAYHKIIAADAVEAGIIHADEVEEARRDLPAAVFGELYLAEAADDTTNPFGLDHIAACTLQNLAAGPVVAWGWDLAKSVDWTVGIGLNEDGDTAAFDRWQGVPWENTFRRIIELTGRTPALVDSTGVGDPVFERLVREGGSNFNGFKFSSSSKQQLMEGLAVGLQRQEVGFPEGPISKELEMFEYEFTRTGVRYSAPPGLHDDCVMALALANRQLRFAVPLQIFL